jgi:hypothetical protein
VFSVGVVATVSIIVTVDWIGYNFVWEAVFNDNVGVTWFVVVVTVVVVIF